MIAGGIDSGERVLAMFFQVRLGDKAHRLL
jgi:hypothetical protein